MEAAIKRHDPDSLLLSRFRHYRFFANTTPRSELPVNTKPTHFFNDQPFNTKGSLMKIFNAMNLIRRVNSERDPIQTLPADDATETLGMVRFACGPQNAVQDGFRAHATLFQRVLKRQKNLTPSLETHASLRTK